MVSSRLLKEYRELQNSKKDPDIDLQLVDEALRLGDHRRERLEALEDLDELVEPLAPDVGVVGRAV